MKPAPPMRGTKGYRRWLRRIRCCFCWLCSPAERARTFRRRRDKARLKQDMETEA